LADRFGAGLVVVGTVEDDVRTVVRGRGDLDQGCHLRHDDASADAVPAGVERDGLCVVAGAGGDDAAASLFVGEGENLVQRAALFEGSGALQIVKLEEDLLAGHLGQAGGMASGRQVDVAADALAGGADGVEGDGHDLSFSTITACKQKSHRAQVERDGWCVALLLGSLAAGSWGDGDANSNCDDHGRGGAVVHG
jgi:hypothetical protein